MNLRPHPSVIALDVGGVIYYDQPFELAWLQGVMERADATVEAFCKRMRDFYLDPAAPRSLFPPAGTESWNEVRARWNDLVQPIPGALRAVDILSRRYRLCVCANQPPECTSALRGLDLTRHLSIVALDSVVGPSKPDPALLQWVLTKAGCPPEELLMVGDRPDQDAAPALALGCRAVTVQPEERWVPPADVHPELLAAYQTVCRERTARTRAVAGNWMTIPDLTALAGTLPGREGHREGLS